MISGTFGFLNEEGKKVYDFFPQGRIPLRSILVESGTFFDDQGKQFQQEMYRVDISKLTEEQYSKLAEIISAKYSVEPAVVKAEYDKFGFIPIRAELISSTCTDRLNFLDFDDFNEEYDDDDDEDYDDDLYEAEKIGDDYSNETGL